MAQKSYLSSGMFMIASEVLRPAIEGTSGRERLPLDVIACSGLVSLASVAVLSVLAAQTLQGFFFVWRHVVCTMVST